ncbi:MAG TPA: hypothetical protein VMJ73_12130 [Rhizomicrobium sp.]|nr:hypothetical protein [Rhizomicrobium sp.]
MPKGKLTTKQKKLASAVAHGWEPKGSAAGMTKAAAKKLHAESTGKYAPSKKKKRS